MKFKTDTSAKIPFSHRVQKTENFGGKYGQDIEPSGMYVIMLDKRNWPSSRKGGPEQELEIVRAQKKFGLKATEYGYIHAKKVLVMDSDGGSVGWKKALSEMYGGKKKKALTRAVQKDGYDVIISQPDGDGENVVVGARIEVVERYEAIEEQQAGFTGHPRIGLSDDPEDYEDDEVEDDDLDEADESDLRSRVKAAKQEPASLLPNIEQVMPASYARKVAQFRSGMAGSAKVTIWRSVPPNTLREIRPGDWVALEKGYAVTHGRGSIVSAVVRADEVYWSGTDLNEWFYVGPHIDLQERLVVQIDSLLVESGKGDTRSFAGGIRDKYDIKFVVSSAFGDARDPDIFELDKIIVPKEQRDQGIGTKVMDEVESFADANGYIVALEPTADFGGKVTKLRKFYAKHGFVKNSGRNKDFRTQKTMIRYPKSR